MQYPTKTAPSSASSPPLPLHAKGQQSRSTIQPPTSPPIPINISPPTSQEIEDEARSAESVIQYEWKTYHMHSLISNARLRRCYERISRSCCSPSEAAASRHELMNGTYLPQERKVNEIEQAAAAPQEAKEKDKDRDDDENENIVGVFVFEDLQM